MASEPVYNTEVEDEFEFEESDISDEDYQEDEIFSEDEFQSDDFERTYNILNCNKSTYEHEWKAEEPVGINNGQFNPSTSLPGPTSTYGSELHAFRAFITHQMMHK